MEDKNSNHQSYIEYVIHDSIKSLGLHSPTNNDINVLSYLAYWLPRESDLCFVRWCRDEEIFDETVDIGARLEGFGVVLVLIRHQLGGGFAMQDLSELPNVPLNTKGKLLESRLKKGTAKYDIKF